jgi:hypothetical protein
MFSLAAYYRILEKDFAAESLKAAMEDRREVSRKLQTEYATQFGYEPRFTCIFQYFHSNLNNYPDAGITPCSSCQFSWLQLHLV